MRFYIDTEFHEGIRKPFLKKESHFLELISIGITNDSGSRLYRISSDFNLREAFDNLWLRINVLTPIYYDLAQIFGYDFSHIPKEEIFQYPHQYKHFEKLLSWYARPNKVIAQEIYQFVISSQIVYEKNKHSEILPEYPDIVPIQFYAYFADYDWVAFCSLFGRMIDLPREFPMYCRDLKQMLDEKMERKQMTYQQVIPQPKHSRSTFILDEETHLRPATLEEKVRWIKRHPGYPKNSKEHDALSDALWNQELFKFIQTL